MRSQENPHSLLIIITTCCVVYCAIIAECLCACVCGVICTLSKLQLFQETMLHW